MKIEIKEDETFLEGLFKFINQPAQRKKFVAQARIEGKTEDEIIHDFAISSCKEFLELLDKKPNLN